MNNNTSTTKLRGMPHEQYSYSAQLAYVGFRENLMVHPGDVDRMIQKLSSEGRGWSVHTVLIWDDSKARHNMFETNAAATLSRWSEVDQRHYHSFGYNGCGGRVTWWEHDKFSTR